MKQWPTVLFGQCVESIRAGVSLTGEGRRPTDDEVGILTLGAVSGGRFAPDECKAVRAYSSRELGPSPRAGTILMSRSNTIDLVGATVFVGADYPNRFLPDLLWEITLKGDSPISPIFLADFLAMKQGRRLLQSAAMGTSGSMKKLAMSRVRRLELPLVPMSLQRTWESLRTAANRATEMLDALITTKLEFKRGLMQELLTGRRRFPEFGTSETCAAGPFGAIPRDWDLVRIREIASEKSERAQDTVFAVLSCTKHKGLVPSLSYFGKQVFSRNLSNYKVVSRNDFAYATNHIEEGSLGLQQELLAGIVSPMYTVFRIDAQRVHADFLYAVLKTEEYRQCFQRLTSGSVNRRGSLRWSKFSTIEVPLPSLREQQRVSAVFHEVDREIDALEQLTIAYANQKQALMRKFLSGELHIPLGTHESMGLEHA